MTREAASSFLVITADGWWRIHLHSAVGDKTEFLESACGTSGHANGGGASV